MNRAAYRLLVMANAATVVVNDPKTKKLDLRNTLLGLIVGIHAELGDGSPDPSREPDA